MYEIAAILTTVALATALCCSARVLGPFILPPLLAGSVVTSIFIAEKLGDIHLPVVGTLAISGSILIYSSTFLLTDVMSELYGRKLAHSAVIGTALCYPIVLAATQFSIHWESSVFYANQPAFENVMGFAGRVTVASLISFMVSQTFDVWAFHHIKLRTGESRLWLRNNGSTIASQWLDTAIFYGIAFYGIIPGMQLIELVIATYLLKIVVALIDTPFVYFVIWFVRRGQQPTLTNP
ncbi:MAG: queuosine precursor transporter, partial [Proteobacteria bacterium]|nr:queuosine precursor transporter [Pseudomonadota bacterium]